MHSKAKKPIRLDLACGTNLQKGFIGVDIVGKPHSQADIVHNLDVFPWPFEDESVDEVFCSHYLEHVDDVVGFFEELYRILKPKGIVKFISPYYTSVRAWQDPTHRRVISEPFFMYFNANWRKQVHIDHYPIMCNFNITKIDHAIDPAFAGKSQEALLFAVQHYWNVVLDIQATLEKIPK